MSAGEALRVRFRGRGREARRVASRWNPGDWTTTTWLGIAVAAYILLAFELSALRFIQFGASNYDYGIYAQSLWDQSHGFGFFEAGDFELIGVTSFLRVHPALIMYALAPAYGATPDPWFLLGVQAAVVGSAAVPLFFLTRDLTRSGRQALLVSALYLLWAPLLAANLYDFHLESFLPLELFSLFLVWNRGHFWIGLLVAAVACLTFEAGPAFVFLIGLFFLAFRTRGDDVDRSRLLVPGTSPETPNAPVPAPTGRLRSYFADRPARFSLALVLGAVAAYALLVWVSGQAGTIYPPYSPRGLANLLSTGPPQLTLHIPGTPGQFATAVVTWTLALALVAFLPVFAPKTWLLLLPWVAVSFLGGPRLLPISDQATFVAAVPVFLGVAFGIAAVARGWDASPKAVASYDSTKRPRFLQRVDWRLERRQSRWVLVFALVLSLNLLLSPANPLVQGNLRAPGGLGNGYWLTYSPSFGYPEIERLVAEVPSNASLLASDVLFPFVANDRNAYGLLFVPPPPLFLPFNASHLPPYFLMSDQQYFAVPPWLRTAVDNGSIYGLAGAVLGTPVGGAFLYELGYRGPWIEYAPGPPPVTSYAYPAMLAGSAGQLVAVPGESPSFKVASIGTMAGVVWYGPFVTLASGSYSVVFNVSLSANNSTLAGSMNRSVLTVLVWGAGTVLAATTRNWTDLAATPFVQITVLLGLGVPISQIEFRGIQLNVGYQVTLNSVTVSPAGY